MNWEKISTLSPSAMTSSSISSRRSSLCERSAVKALPFEDICITSQITVSGGPAPAAGGGIGATAGGFSTGGAPAAGAVPWRLWAAGLGAILAMWVVGLAAVAVFRLKPFRAGAFSQATYRFNTYVAIAVVWAAQGDAGAARLAALVNAAGFSDPALVFKALDFEGVLVQRQA